MKAARRHSVKTAYRSLWGRFGTYNNCCNVRGAMPKLRAALAALGLCVLASARPASAQSITLNANSVTHSRSGRGSNQLDTQLNIADCTMGDELSFALSVVDPNRADTLQVWAGSAC